MIKKEKNGVVWFEFDLLQQHPKLRHAVFSRLGGVSEGSYASLNLSISVGDHPDHVKENRKRAWQAIGLDESVSFVSGHQVHDCKVFAVESKPDAIQVIDACDAFTTNLKKTALVIQHADCQAGILYDQKNHALATIHSGWRGSVKNIYAKTIELMQQKFNTNPSELLACISPSLGPNRAEFIHYQKELPEHFWRFETKPTYFDFWKISRAQLEEKGVPPNQIEIAGLCTNEDAEHFFSYRREKISGRHFTLAWLT